MGPVFAAILASWLSSNRRVREIYRNPWMVLREDDIRRPDGSSGVYAVVDKPTYALVMPYDGHRFRLVEQFRYPVGARRWEFPQGTAPGVADTEPFELAERELREETGLRATSFDPLGRSISRPGCPVSVGGCFWPPDCRGGIRPRARGTGHAQCVVFARRGRADDPLFSDRRFAVDRRIRPVPASPAMNSAVGIGQY